MRKWKAILIVGAFALFGCITATAEEANGGGQNGIAAEAGSGDQGFAAFKTKLAEALNQRSGHASGLPDKLGPEAGAEEIMAACASLAEEESKMLSDFSDSFNEGEGQNQEYIRKNYMEGLEQQMNADQSSEENFWSAWNAGCEKRAQAVIELISYYDGDGSMAGTLSSEIISELEESAGEPCQDDSYEACFIQVLIGMIGSDVDGDIGDGTLRQLKQFEQERDMELCGVVNEDLIRRMVQNDVITEQEFNSTVEKLSTEYGKPQKDGFSYADFGRKETESIAN